MEINVNEGVVWLFAIAAFILAVATGAGVYNLSGGDKNEERSLGGAFLVFAVSAIGYFVLLVWLFNDSPALQ